ncbi:MAG: hypothetical protein EP330_27410 [Deltaproteobacteria bacterium]|nr:MAG: hypothetical protein EP330_27410 [Deltaproteobacteria bacterium]
MGWFLLVAVALACPRPVIRQRVVEMPASPWTPAEAVVRRVDPTLAGLEPVLLPSAPDAIEPERLRFGAWVWDFRSGQGRYDGTGLAPRGQWWALDRDEVAAVRWRARHEDRGGPLRLDLATGVFEVRADGVWREDPWGEAVVWQGTVRAVRASALGRYVLIDTGENLVSIDTATAEVADRAPGKVEASNFDLDPWTGAIHPAHDASLSQVTGACGEDCFARFAPTMPSIGRPARVLDWQGEPITALVPLAPTCAVATPEQLTVWAHGRERVYDVASGELVGDEPNDRSTWLVSSRAMLLDGALMGIGARPRHRELQRGVCGDRAETEGLRVWTFADGTWISLTDGGVVRGTQVAGHLGWQVDDAFVPLLPPSALDPEPPTEWGSGSWTAGGALWAGLGMIAAVPWRRPRREDC